MQNITISIDGDESNRFVPAFFCSLTDEITIQTTTSVQQLDDGKYQFTISSNSAKGFISTLIVSTENTDMGLKLMNSGGKLLTEKIVHYPMGKIDRILYCDVVILCINGFF